MAGIEFLSDYMSDFKDDYVLIGGNACALHFAEAEADFRETVDLDVVLVIETIKDDFYRRLSDFLVSNNYEGKVFRGSNPGGAAYRFILPEEHRAPNKPTQIELFTRKPEYFDEAMYPEGHITPLPTGSAISNFSAIILDDELYNYILDSKLDVKGVTTVNLECLLGLKSFAWHSNQELFDEGKINSYIDVVKHPNDMLRIISILPEAVILYPQKLFESLQLSKTKFEDDSMISHIQPGLIETETAVAFINEFIHER
ncbi:hypothetical protein ACWKX9_26060 [Enterobacter asburiae]